jgi:hypothetical protein
MGQRASVDLGALRKRSDEGSDVSFGVMHAIDTRGLRGERTHVRIRGKPGSAGRCEADHRWLWWVLQTEPARLDEHKESIERIAMVRTENDAIARAEVPPCLNRRVGDSSIEKGRFRPCFPN